LTQSLPKTLQVRGAESHGHNPGPVEQATRGVQAQAERPAGVRSLIDELEAATHEASQERRVQMLHRVTDLFVGSASALGPDQADLFGDVLSHLIQRVESEVLADFGARLAPVANAPRTVIQSLARHDQIAVAGPVLARSIRLTDYDLVEIAKTKSQEHLGAISERPRIGMAVTDVLVERGNANVVHKLSRNQGAVFSNAGFRQLAQRAAGDEHLAENLARRLDLPVNLLQELVSQATEAVRGHLLAAAPPDRQGIIEPALASASGRVLRDAAAPRDFSRAVALIANLAKKGALDETAILKFASTHQYEEMVAGLARLSSAPVKLIDQLMNHVRHDGVLVACKAASIHWPVCSAILMNRLAHHEVSAAEMERARSEFLKLSAATAKQAFRFWIIRGLGNMQGEDAEQPH